MPRKLEPLLDAFELVDVDLVDDDSWWPNSSRTSLKRHRLAALVVLAALSSPTGAAAGFADSRWLTTLTSVCRFKG